MQSLPVLFSILLLSYGCAPVSSDREGSTDTVSVKADSISQQEIEIAKPEESTPSELSGDSVSGTMKQALIDLFQDPLDLRTYKINKRGSNSSSIIRRPYFRYIDTVGHYFHYFWFHSYRRDASITNSHEAVKVNTFIYGETIGRYEDVVEELISIKGRVKDPDLGKLNVVGLSKQDIHDQVGQAVIRDQDLYVYQYMTDILILHFENDQVDWFNFLRTNLELTSLEDLPAELMYYNERVP